MSSGFWGASGARFILQVLALGWVCGGLVLPATPAVMAQTPISTPVPARDSSSVVPAALRFASPPTSEPAVTPALQTPEAITAAIESLQKDTALESALRDRLLQTLNGILEQMKQRSADADRMAGIVNALASAAEDTRRARQLVDATPQPEPPLANVAQMSIERVREGRAEAEAVTNGARQQLQAIDAMIRERQTRKEILPKLIQETRKGIDDLEASAIAAIEDDPGGRLKLVREAERAARLATLRQRAETLVQEQALIEAETDLLPLRQTLAKRELASSEERLRWWSKALRERRESQIESALAEHRETLKRDGVNLEQSMVLSLAERWMEAVAEIETIERRRVKQLGSHDELNQTLKSTRDEIERDLSVGGGLRAGLGLKLQLLQRKLPTLSDLRSEIDATDVAIDEARSLLTNLELTLDETLSGSMQPISVGKLNSLPMKDGEVHPAEVKLLKRFAADLEHEIAKLAELKGLYELKRETVEELRHEIDKHVMWIRNMPRYGLDDARMAWMTVRWILLPSNFQLLGSKLIDGLIARVDRFALLLGSIVFLAAFASRTRRRVMERGKQACAKTANSLRPTWAALLLTFILALPLSVALWALGGMLRVVADGETIVEACAAALTLSAAGVLPLELLRQMLRPGGLAESHFGINAGAITPLREGLRVFIDLGTPLLILWSVSQSLGRAQVDASLGRLIFAIGMSLVAMLVWQSLHPRRGLLSGHLRRNQDGWLSRLRHVWFAAAVGVPLLLAGVSLFGYSYAAVKLVDRLYWTLWLALATFLCGGLVRRWLLIQRRRLAWAVRREKMEQSERLESSVFDLAGDDGLEAAEINAQTSRLIQTVLTIAAMVGVGVVWSPVFPAIRFLDSFHLWDTKLADGTLEPVTLSNLLLTIPIIVLTWVAVRNLPGLIEGVLLERLPLEKAVRYAITSLASYAMLGAGVLFSAKTLGLRWESIQWLVAALGVGLGFGLQEIFANFVSGLILLFEQPIRIGDVVTLGDTTGVVSRIRIRATTVTNWDRQELVIPNKDLITGRLINWTLSDSTNRVLINVGIAHGSDTRLACQILETICQEHPQITDDPKPVVVFESFGQSTLNLSLRCFLTSLDVRMQTIHELHTEINDRFMSANIKIAFPQQDLHVRTLPAEFYRLVSQERRAA